MATIGFHLEAPDAHPYGTVFLPLPRRLEHVSQVDSVCQVGLVIELSLVFGNPLDLVVSLSQSCLHVHIHPTNDVDGLLSLLFLVEPQFADVLDAFSSSPDLGVSLFVRQLVVQFLISNIPFVIVWNGTRWCFYCSIHADIQ